MLWSLVAGDAAGCHKRVPCKVSACSVHFWAGVLLPLRGRAVPLQGVAARSCCQSAVCALELGFQCRCHCKVPLSECCLRFRALLLVPLRPRQSAAARAVCFWAWVLVPLRSPAAPLQGAAAAVKVLCALCSNDPAARKDILLSGASAGVIF